VSEDGIADLQKLIALSGTPDAVLTEISRVLGDRVDHSVIEHLQNIIRALPEGPGKEMLRFDFSVVDDFHYYNGLVFKGFVQGIPQSVLSGGQYDKLMRKMGRTSDAVGFAVYMDMLERLDTSKKAYDVDVILLYDAGDDLNNVRNQAEAMIQSGSSVMVQRTVPENIRYRKLMKMTGNEVTILGNDA
jgi:ATP phosphoribosyltransferase regulatory subunit